MGLNLEEVPLPQFNGKHKLPNLLAIVGVSVLFVVAIIVAVAGERELIFFSRGIVTLVVIRNIGIRSRSSTV